MEINIFILKYFKTHIIRKPKKTSLMGKVQIFNSCIFTIFFTLYLEVFLTAFNYTLSWFIGSCIVSYSVSVLFVVVVAPFSVAVDLNRSVSW